MGSGVEGGTLVSHPVMLPGCGDNILCSGEGGGQRGVSSDHVGRGAGVRGQSMGDSGSADTQQWRRGGGCRRRRRGEQNRSGDRPARSGGRPAGSNGYSSARSGHGGGAVAGGGGPAASGGGLAVKRKGTLAGGGRVLSGAEEAATGLPVCEQNARMPAPAPERAHIYSNGQVHTNGSVGGNALICSAFLANIDEHKYVSVWIFGKSYSLPPWSVSILPDCKNVAFNTARVGAQTSVFTIESGSPSHSSRHKPSILSLTVGGPLCTWWTCKEAIGTWGGNNFAAQGILEHLNVTKDISDYLWYTTRVNISDSDVALWSSKGVLPSLTIDQIRDVARVFVNGKLAGSQVGQWVSLKQPIQLVGGVNELTLLSEIVGLQNYGAFLEKDGAGFRGQVKLTGLSDRDIDLTNSLWTYQCSAWQAVAGTFGAASVRRLGRVLQRPLTWHREWGPGHSRGDGHDRVRDVALIVSQNLSPAMI
ncbi:hypothetical protein GUJ93_ZPchr0009g1307 [Zizania palustris]|uniref:Beta-galactosidase beta-sandwich domain-containing protein n=1 Tax=Zizania palustris TaxID=103762 RepID=A0A8J5V2E4_ZIZPA|nr:hypothetical protein GUJ93_ZPchr0009g1307 [Zizania palustris]